MTNFFLPEKKKSETHSRRKSRPLDGREGMAAQQHFLRRTQPLDSKLKTVCERKKRVCMRLLQPRKRNAHTHTHIQLVVRRFYVLRMPESHFWLLKMNEFDVGFLRVVFCVCKERLNGKWALTKTVVFCLPQSGKREFSLFSSARTKRPNSVLQTRVYGSTSAHNSNGIIKEQTLAI